MVLKTSVLKMAQVKARIWSCLANMFQIRSTAAESNLVLGDLAGVEQFPMIDQHVDGECH